MVCTLSSVQYPQVILFGNSRMNSRLLYLWAHWFITLYVWRTSSLKFIYIASVCPLKLHASNWLPKTYEAFVDHLTPIYLTSSEHSLHFQMTESHIFIRSNWISQGKGFDKKVHHCSLSLQSTAESLTLNHRHLSSVGLMTTVSTTPPSHLLQLWLPSDSSQQLTQPSHKFTSGISHITMDSKPPFTAAKDDSLTPDGSDIPLNIVWLVMITGTCNTYFWQPGHNCAHRDSRRCWWRGRQCSWCWFCSY